MAEKRSQVQKGIDQFLPSALLAIDAGNFFDPAHPPIAVLL